MKRGTLKLFLGAIAMAGFSLDALADVKENPYQVIIDRNPFNLRPIPPPAVATVVETNAPPVPPPEIKLTGITTLSGSPKVFLQLEDKQTKKTSFPAPLAAGENINEITIVSIDVDNNTVRIKNGDAETTLDFEKNGVKAAAVAAAPAPQPGMPHLNTAAGIPPVPGGVSPAQPANNVPGRGAIVSGGSPTVAAPTAYGALGNLPARPLRTDNNVGNVGVAPGGGSLIMAGGGNQVYNPNPQPTPTLQQPTLSREDAEARIEAQRRMLEQNNSAVSRLLPPTTLGRSLNPPTVPNPTAPR